MTLLCPGVTEWRWVCEGLGFTFCELDPKTALPKRIQGFSDNVGSAEFPTAEILLFARTCCVSFQV